MTLAFRGGLMRLLGLEIVTARGQAAARLRVLARTALAWVPILQLNAERTCQIR